MKNIIEETLKEYKIKFFPNYIDNDYVNQLLQGFLHSSLQKAINAERERCLGCVPKKYDKPWTNPSEIEGRQELGFNIACDEVINKIKGESN